MKKLLNKKIGICIISIFLSQQIHSQDLKPSLSLSTAHKIMDGCLAFADSSKLNMAIAIFDSHGQLVQFAKMDGASTGTAKAALWKGLSAAIYQYSTEETGKWNVPTAPDIATVPGGLVIKNKEGIPIGGIGISGSASSIDVKCAQAGLKAIR